VALRWNFSGLVYPTDPVKVSKDAASLLVRTRKKIFAWGMRFFCEWPHKWRTFRAPWPTLPGPSKVGQGGPGNPERHVSKASHRGIKQQ